MKSGVFLYTLGQVHLLTSLWLTGVKHRNSWGFEKIHV
jgi:hypothetical protein